MKMTNLSLFEYLQFNSLKLIFHNSIFISYNLFFDKLFNNSILTDICKWLGLFY